MESVLVPGAKILDVGCGSGYLCAAFWELVHQERGQGCSVVGIEHIDPLAEISRQNLAKSYS